MKNRRFLSALLLTLCLAVINVRAQDTKQAQTKDDETNLETQLYLIVGTDADVPDVRVIREHRGFSFPAKTPCS